MFCCYILQSLKNGRYYIGSCADVTKRLYEHNAGLVKSTKNYFPWQLVSIEKFMTRSEAMKQERRIKNWKKRIAIEKYISKNKS